MTERVFNAYRETEPVWVHHLPISKYPQFPSLDHDIETDVCIIGSGIAGISTAYELITGDRVAHIISTLDLDCEFRYVPAYRHEADNKIISKGADYAGDAGIDAVFQKGFSVSGWDGDVSQEGAAVFAAQGTFHPTKYLLGVIEWLKAHPNFQCFADTRAMGVEEGRDNVIVWTEQGYIITAKDVVEATCIPLQDSSILAEMSYSRTYCIAIRGPRYDRLTACDDNNDYLVVGGCDHKVGQEDSLDRFEILATWARQRFAHAGSVDYHWSGQILEPVDHMAFIGKKEWKMHTYVITGDSGNGLTHGVLGGRLIADEIEGRENSWAALYEPSRMTVQHDIRFVIQLGSSTRDACSS
ncbi:hypothetical protein BJX63DRAFT_425136 [Aspergillus granulosus]|uniref:FAD dependent oxidoreductase domain-containing protein n=1 Tax=Aspergillus granulosus TaxID=176169 RepID=A0ABR4GYQ1_9EURO